MRKFNQNECTFILRLFCNNWVVPPPPLSRHKVANFTENLFIVCIDSSSYNSFQDWLWILNTEDKFDWTLVDDISLSAALLSYFLRLSALCKDETMTYFSSELWSWARLISISARSQCDHDTWYHGHEPTPTIESRVLMCANINIICLRWD